MRPSKNTTVVSLSISGAASQLLGALRIPAIRCASPHWCNSSGSSHCHPTKPPRVRNRRHRREKNARAMPTSTNRVKTGNEVHATCHAQTRRGLAIFRDASSKGQLCYHVRGPKGAYFFACRSLRARGVRCVRWRISSFVFLLLS